MSALQIPEPPLSIREVSGRINGDLRIRVNSPEAIAALDRLRDFAYPEEAIGREGVGKAIPKTLQQVHSIISGGAGYLSFDGQEAFKRLGEFVNQPSN